MTDKQTPLILVVYIDADMMSNGEMIQPFVESVNDMIAEKNANVMAFFLPTKGEDRIECLNPTMLKEQDLEKVEKMIEDIKTSFSIGIDIDVPDEEITLNDTTCECGGNCQCNKTE